MFTEYLSHLGIVQCPKIYAIALQHLCSCAESNVRRFKRVCLLNNCASCAWSNVRTRKAWMLFPMRRRFALLSGNFCVCLSSNAIFALLFLYGEWCRVLRVLPDQFESAAAGRAAFDPDSELIDGITN